MCRLYVVFIVQGGGGGGVRFKYYILQSIYIGQECYVFYRVCLFILVCIALYVVLYRVRSILYIHLYVYRTGVLYFLSTFYDKNSSIYF